MAIEIFMPALSPTMEKGTLAKWLVKEGDTISSGDVIAEIETDKATMEVESIDDGTVAKILVAEGTDDVPVGKIIAMLAEEGEDVASVEAPAAAAAPAPAPAVEAKAEQAVKPVVDAIPTPVNGQITDAQVVNPQVTDAVTGDRVKASPLARRIASQEGVDIAAVSGTGPHGRVIKRDVEAALKSGTAQAVAPATQAAQTAVAPATVGAAPTYGPHDDIPYREERLSNMRKTIAKRLTESKQHVPHFYLTIDCEMDKLMEQRKVLNAKLAETGTKLSVNDFIIRASALALKKVPAANVQFAGDKMYWYERADISVAVAIEGGLVTPVIRGADQKGLGEISADMKDLATRARDGKLMPEDYAGGTFSISNLGMYGIKEFGAVINPPQGAILAVGAGEQRPVVKDGALAVATVMSCTLSCDHRAVDGAVGAQFLAAFKGYIEDPITMLL
ncbi:pyruvate dehydrogenase complex dihydrolipoamide acetyltransferase [Kordiimonas marina]|uniref:pyruvate dehydrogenase complex dihydrolipoamide acetyltransferase n=1 Tax=Kordiimonas marina TaxID=2872312 RepID=UPI001FF4FB6F|nr:pyruvate dehydrogenase complex dihydrolipoamide acetyltransferase [Kordiimonas marina]MCJ9428783.1 pyruvate dehydrogenase complex dihydrolipoamide acetyltransferase [Kordiimonas marina]